MRASRDLWGRSWPRTVQRSSCTRAACSPLRVTPVVVAVAPRWGRRTASGLQGWPDLAGRHWADPGVRWQVYQAAVLLMLPGGFEFNRHCAGCCAAPRAAT